MGKRELHIHKEKRESILAQKKGGTESVAAVIGPEVETHVTWLQSKGLLRRNKTCPACNQQMDMQHRSDITDKYRMEVPRLVLQKERLVTLWGIL